MRVAAPDRYFWAAVEGETTAVADADRIEQVFTSLLGNAVKVTPVGGRIEVSVRRSGRAVVAAVRDFGTGMPEEVQKRIFERLCRAPDSYREGLGLGLSICKGIVDAHRGRIWFESKEGGGQYVFL